jgi:hypothetical protein
MFTNLKIGNFTPSTSVSLSGAVYPWSGTIDGGDTDLQALDILLVETEFRLEETSTIDGASVEIWLRIDGADTVLIGHAELIASEIATGHFSGSFTLSETEVTEWVAYTQKDSGDAPNADVQSGTLSESRIGKPIGIGVKISSGDAACTAYSTYIMRYRPPT